MFPLNINTPEGKQLKLHVKRLSLPTGDGIYTILSKHMDVYVTIEVGVMKIIMKDEVRTFAVSNGLFNLRNNIGNLFVNTFEEDIEIDKKRAKKAYQKSKLVLAEENGYSEMKIAEISLKKAINRLKVGI